MFFTRIDPKKSFIYPNRTGPEKKASDPNRVRKIDPIQPFYLPIFLINLLESKYFFIWTKLEKRMIYLTKVGTYVLKLFTWMRTLLF